SSSSAAEASFEGGAARRICWGTTAVVEESEAGCWAEGDNPPCSEMACVDWAAGTARAEIRRARGNSIANLLAVHQNSTAGEPAAGWVAEDFSFPPRRPCQT